MISSNSLVPQWMACRLSISPSNLPLFWGHKLDWGSLSCVIMPPWESHQDKEKKQTQAIRGLSPGLGVWRCTLCIVLAWSSSTEACPAQPHGGRARLLNSSQAQTLQLSPAALIVTASVIIIVPHFSPHHHHQSQQRPWQQQQMPNGCQRRLCRGRDYVGTAEAHRARWFIIWARVWFSLKLREKVSDRDRRDTTHSPSSSYQRPPRPSCQALSLPVCPTSGADSERQESVWQLVVK